ncbi:MAG: hypothetical protein GWN84_20510 [Gammaproteobacteria bacterium]|nr:hypothetical protein [Gammaproteobacteria bacterium]NIR85144.1 hypothetical protein [Gammaproteobacteria bacterium]NIU06193.1 hypothetical protein [Gammaproteobacteria bacterium]NIX87466.1 hypothetical protein [Gammaproteobacteria bacterium]
MPPPARIDFTPVWDAIRQWVVKVTGLPDSDVTWADWPQGYKGAAEVRLSPIALPTVAEEVIYTDTGATPVEGTLEASKCSMRMLSVSMAVRSRSQDPGEFALGYAVQLEEAAELEVELLDEEDGGALSQLLEQAKVAVSQVLRRPVVSSYEWQGRVEQQCSLDLEFAVGGSTSLGEVGWFNRVEVSSEASNVDGSPLPDELQVEDEGIGPPT